MDAPVLYLMPGRHQPPHDDHFALIRSALARVPGDLYLALIAAPPAGGAPDSELEREARAANAPSRCPYSFDTRRRMLEAGAAELLLPEETARLRIVPLVRPELAWSTVELVFGGPRTWIVPDVGERFDDLKADFFTARGDAVLRLCAPVRTSGFLVRKLIAERDPRLVEHVPSSVAAIVEEQERKHETGSSDRWSARRDRQHADRNRIESARG